jgi:exonuclease III
MNLNSKLNISVTAINVNSFNLSTIERKDSKTFLKVEGVTMKKSDVIFLSDIKGGNKGKELKKLFSLTMHGSYKLYMNSTKDSRGVAIAVKRNIYHEIIETVQDRVDENFILLKMKFKSSVITLGCIYGPNGNNPNFFREIRRHLERMGEKFIIGGDMDTILCNDLGNNNVDRVGGGRTPNVQNSRELNNWISDDFAVEPFRTIYPLQQEFSYVPFRTRGVEGNRGGNIVTKTRLDFFMISPSLLDMVSSIRYDD